MNLDHNNFEGISKHCINISY